MRTGTLKFLRYSAIILPGTAYLAWNCFFLMKRQFPPSIFQTLTGLPCPSSGCVRSFYAMRAGEWQTAFLYNPFFLPFAAVFAASAFFLAYNLVHERRLRLPPVFGTVWLCLLAAAWITKFVIGSEYW